MSSFAGIVKVKGGEWTNEEMILVKDLHFLCMFCKFAVFAIICKHLHPLKDIWKKKQDAFVEKMKLTGYDVQNISIPLPDYGCLKKYRRDNALKATLKPYQTINPFRLKKPIVD